jgi:hypothetical protein
VLGVLAAAVLAGEHRGERLRLSGRGRPRSEGLRSAPRAKIVITVTS